LTAVGAPQRREQGGGAGQELRERGGGKKERGCSLHKSSEPVQLVQESSCPALEVVKRKRGRKIAAGVVGSESC